MLATCRGSAASRITSNAVASCSFVPVYHSSPYAAQPVRHTHAAAQVRYQEPSEITGARRTAWSKQPRTQINEGPRVRVPKDVVRVRPLKPWEVVQRMDTLLEEGLLEQAITMVQNLPMGAQNVVVWNTLIVHAIKLQRYRRAFEIYYDMKKRHIKPTTRTYGALLVGLSKTENWSEYGNVLNRIHAAYDQLLVHFEKLRSVNKNDPDIAVWPVNAYLKILGDAKLYRRMWDVFVSLGDIVKADDATFSIMFRAIRDRTELADSVQVQRNNGEALSPEMKRWEDQFEDDFTLARQPEEGLPIVGKESEQTAEVAHRNAQDAILIWGHLVREAADLSTDVRVSGYHIAPMLYTLAHGRPSDHKFGFEIVQSFLRLKTLNRAETREPENANAARNAIPPTAHRTVQLDPRVLTSVLILCCESEEYQRTIDYFNQLSRDRQRYIIDAMHMNIVFRAFLKRKDAKDAKDPLAALLWMYREEHVRGPEDRGRLNPRQHHCHLVLSAAAQAADMDTAQRVLQLMCGVEPHLLKGGYGDDFVVSEDNSRSAKYTSIFWDTQAMSLFLDTAFATSSQANLKVAVRVFREFRTHRFFTRPVRDKSDLSKLITMAETKVELAAKMLTCLETLLNDEKAGNANDYHIWRRLRLKLIADHEDMVKKLASLQEQQLAEVTPRAVPSDPLASPLVLAKWKRSQWIDE